MKLRNMITQDWGRKLAAIVFACLIYGTVRLQLQEQKTFERVRVQIIPEDPRTVVLNEEEFFATVAIRGTGRRLESIKNDEIQIRHRIPHGTKIGPYQGELKAKDVKLPHGVSVAKDSIMPRRFSVDLDRIDDKEVDIRFRFDPSTLGPGLTLKPIEADVKAVKITGPSKYLAAIREIETEEIPYPSKMRDEVAIDLLKPPHVIRMEPRRVNAVIELHQRRDNRYFAGVPVQVVAPPGSNLYVEKFEDKPAVSFTVEGDRNELNFLTMVNIKAFVDLSDPLLMVGKTMLQVKVWVGKDGCVPTKPSPSSLKVVIGRRKTPPQ